MKRCLTFFLMLFIAQLLTAEKYEDCRATESLECFSNILEDETASFYPRIYSGIYLIKLCKDTDNKDRCQYVKYANKINEIAENNKNNVDIVFDLKFYYALALFHEARIQYYDQDKHQEGIDGIKKSTEILEKMIQNFDKLKLVYPYMIFIQLWNNHKVLGNNKEALDNLEIAYEVAPNKKISQHLGSVLFKDLRNKADLLTKEGNCHHACNQDKCRDALYIYKRLENFVAFSMNETTYQTFYKKYIREGISAGRACLFGKNSKSQK